jgi:Do/DeqQ family serine protease
MKKTYVFSALIALLITSTTISLYHHFFASDGKTIKVEHVAGVDMAKPVLTTNSAGEIIPLDFTKVAEKTMDAVVHIKSTHTYANNGYSQNPNSFPDLFRDDFFRDFFQPRNYQPQQQNRPQVRVGQGSGVIISEDGYIVTNNHVIADADDIEVTLYDNRNYKATIIGTDPSTDLALLQIKEKNLPTLPLVNSDEVKIGEWVMAIGNPFNLNSTVTAGIVSAKGRNINILKEQFAVESFIQTDAAINPGNSGGALVNLNGGLIGINTAIASPTGAYSGYGFAVPTNIVSKVVDDLIKYGVVQRGVLGVMIRTVDGNLQKDKNLEVNTGAYVDSLLENSAAGASGIKPGDVIISVNEQNIKNSSALQEAIARHRPGDVVELKVNRAGKEKIISVTLNNRKGNTQLVEKEHKEILNILGVDFENLDKETLEKLDINSGVRVKRLYPGKLRKQTQIREGFIITKIDDKLVRSVDELIKQLEKKEGGVMLEGIYEDLPGEYYYAFGL